MKSRNMQEDRRETGLEKPLVLSDHQINWDELYHHLTASVCEIKNPHSSTVSVASYLLPHFSILIRSFEQAKHEEDLKTFEWNNSLRRLHQSKIKEENDLQQKKGRKKISISFLVAACFVLLAGVGFIIQQKSRENKSITENKTLESWRLVGKPEKRFRSIQLPDGTVIKLYPGSTLKVAYTQEGFARKVQVIGMAYFEVESSPEHPFWVEGNDVLVRVTGTKFTYLNDTANAHRSTQVQLIEGRVQMHATTTSKRGEPMVQLIPGEMFLYHHAEKEWRITPLNSNEMAAAASGQWVLKNRKLEEIAAIFDQIYGTKTVFHSKKIKQLGFSGIVHSYGSAYSWMPILEAARCKGNWLNDTLNIHPMAP